jgi:hypothetical protein
MENDSSDKAKIGGILSIISGAFGVLWLLMVLAAAGMFMIAPDFSFAGPDRMGLSFMILVYGLMGLFWAAFGVLAIIGGCFAIKRKHWGWALAGAITGALIFFPTGVAAIIFIALGQSEFDQPDISNSGNTIQQTD